MTLANFITRLNYVLRGLDDDAPSSGTTEHTYWLNTLNMVKDNLYENVGQNWSLTHKTATPNEPGTVATAGTTTLTGTSTNFTDYTVGDTVLVEGETVRTIATITSDTVLTVTVAFSTTDSGLTFTRAMIIATGVQDYSLHRSFIGPSSQAKIVKTDGNATYLDFIHPEENDNVSRNIYLQDENPVVLTFTTTIASTENIVGGTLTVPGYYMPADLTTATDILPFSDPNWAVYQVASEIAFNDITYEDKAPDLNAKANALYNQMVRKNFMGTHKNPRVTPTNVKRIGL